MSLPLRRLVAAALRRVTGEGTRGRELAELVADHVFGHEHGQELVPVVDTEREADELRQDRRAARSDLDDLVAARRAGFFGLLEEVPIDERALPD
jgi:hypothetical protein